MNPKEAIEQLKKLREDITQDIKDGREENIENFRSRFMEITGKKPD